MTKYFITYGNAKFELAKKRIEQEAINLNIFDKIILYSEKDISEELKNSDVFKEKRGAGLWSWKPDVIKSTLAKMNDGDYLVYCDAGCSLYKSREWQKYFKMLEQHDILAQRIYQRNDKWSRKNILEYFKKSNPQNWEKCYQYLATVIILKATPFTRQFFTEWRNLMMEHPEMVKDVNQVERQFENNSFIENRHDQALYSALVYKYTSNGNFNQKILTKWEHIEDCDLIFKQAIRATRLRNGETKETTKRHIIAISKRLAKDYLLRPFKYAPLQWYYNK